MSENPTEQVQAVTQADGAGELAENELEAVAGGGLIDTLVEATKALVDTLAGPIV